METIISEIADGIYRPLDLRARHRPAGRLHLNQFLILGDEPLMFHTGLRKMFPLNRGAVGRLYSTRTLRWIAFWPLRATSAAR